MQILRTKNQLLNKSELNIVLAILRAGGVIVYPTDTSYGIGCDATNTKAVKKVFVIKQRPIEKQVSVMVSGIAMAKQYSQWNKKAQELAQQWWPGALTIVLKKKKGKGTIGMREPKHALALQIVKVFGKPIVTTSANISGQRPCYSIPSFLKQLSVIAKVSRDSGTPEVIHPEIFINIGALPKREPSTVVDASSVQLRILRRGKAVVDSRH